MAKHQRKKRAPDPAEFGFAMMQRIGAVTGEPPTTDGKNAAAVALGRKGGLKGGPARARKLGKKKLSAIGRKMAKARWAHP